LREKDSAGGVLIFGLVAEKKKKDEPDVITKETPIKDLNFFTGGSIGRPAARNGRAIFT